MFHQKEQVVKTHNRTVYILLISVMLLSSCTLLMPTVVATQTPAPTATVPPTPTPRPEKNISLNKPVRVSASWVVDPPERAVDGNLNNWWGAGGPVPAWIEVDLQGLYSVSRIRVINQGPTGTAAYQVFGRGVDRSNQLLHTFEGSKSENQTLEFSPEEPWQDISTVRIEINAGSGWVGLREIQIFSREEPKPLPSLAKNETPLYEAGIQADKLEPITRENAIFLQPLAMFGHGPVNKTVWSPDGRLLAVASPLGVWLYDSSSLKSTPRLLEGHTRDVLGVTFSPDGKIVLSASQDGTVKQWDASTGELKRTFHLWDNFSDEIGDQKRDKEVWSVAFSADGTRLAAGAYDGSLNVWDLTKGKVIANLKGHKHQIAEVAFSPDGTLLASTSYDGSFFVWNVTTGSQRKDLSNPARVQTFAFSPDGSTLAYGGIDMNVRLWDTATGEQTDELKEQKNVLHIAFVPDGSGFITATAEGTLQFWDVEARTSRVFKDSFGWVTSLAIHPAGNTLATVMWSGVLQLWDLNTGNQLDGLVAHTSPVNSVALHPNGTTLAAAGDDGIIWMWDVKKNSISGALLGHRGGVTGVEFSPDGSLIASSSYDKTVRLWNAKTLEQVAILSGHESYVRCVAFSPDGKTVASGGTDKTVRLWDVTTGKELATLTGHEGEVESVSFSPDGKWLLSASSDKTLRLWDVAAKEEANVLRGHLSFALSAVFNPRNPWLVSAGGDHSVRLWSWDVVSGKATGKLLSPQIGHGGWVVDVTYSPDGDLIASANVSTTSYWVAPGEIHLYGSDNGYPYVLLRGHTKRVTSLAFSADGKLLASGSADGSVRIWGVVVDDSISAPQATTQPTTSSAPTDQPVTSAPPANLPKSGNLALRQVTTTSKSEAARPSDRAVDGSTSTDWGSGDFPPQWIEIDLGAPATVKSFRLLVTQYPNGTTIHRILLRSADGEFTEVHRFEQFTSSGQWLIFKLPEPMQNIQFVRIETLQSPSWVGWVEIEVMGER